MTQAALAARLNRPQSFVSKYERGERRLDVVEFGEVARALGIDPLAFLGRFYGGED
jgi:transcriptional regulator with XRE-family HTH domain